MANLIYDTLLAEAEKHGYGEEDLHKALHVGVFVTYENRDVESFHNMRYIQLADIHEDEIKSISGGVKLSSYRSMVAVFNENDRQLYWIFI